MAAIRFLALVVLGVWALLPLAMVAAQIVVGYRLSDKSQVLPLLDRFPAWRLARRVLRPLTGLGALAALVWFAR